MFQRGRRKGQESEGERWRSKTRDPEIEMMEKEKNRDRGGRAESWRETRRRRRGGGLQYVSSLCNRVNWRLQAWPLQLSRTNTHTHAHSTCVRLTDSSFITINQLQPPQVCTNPPTAGGKGRRTGERCKRSRPPRRKYVEGNKEK